MDKAKKALIWIINILNKHNIPYQIEGGLAANCYGATRKLADIDIFVPSFGFSMIADEVKEYIEFGPDYHIGTHWKLNYQILNYYGQQIEICDADNAEILDTEHNIWITVNIDFRKSETIDILGISSKVIPKRNLIKYKNKLKREVDIIDIEQITKIK